jgi:hypothetical protein
MRGVPSTGHRYRGATARPLIRETADTSDTVVTDGPVCRTGIGTGPSGARPVPGSGAGVTTREISGRMTAQLTNTPSTRSRTAMRRPYPLVLMSARIGADREAGNDNHRGLWTTVPPVENGHKRG